MYTSKKNNNNNKIRTSGTLKKILPVKKVYKKPDLMTKNINNQNSVRNIGTKIINSVNLNTQNKIANSIENKKSINNIVIGNLATDTDTDEKKIIAINNNNSLLNILISLYNKKPLTKQQNDYLKLALPNGKTCFCYESSQNLIPIKNIFEIKNQTYKIRAIYQSDLYYIIGYTLNNAININNNLLVKSLRRDKITEDLKKIKDIIVKMYAKSATSYNNQKPQQNYNNANKSRTSIAIQPNLKTRIVKQSGTIIPSAKNNFNYTIIKPAEPIVNNNNNQPNINNNNNINQNTTAKNNVNTTKTITTPINTNNNNKPNINYNNQNSTANNNQYIALNNNNNNYNNFNKPTQAIVNNNNNQPNINNNINLNRNTNIPTNTLNNQINEKDFIINVGGSYSELGILENKIISNGIDIEEINSINILIFLQNIIENLSSRKYTYSQASHFYMTLQSMRTNYNDKIKEVMNCLNILNTNQSLILQNIKDIEKVKQVYNKYLDIALQKAKNNHDEKLKCFINANLKHHKLEKMVLENQNTVINNNYNLNIQNKAVNNTKTITTPINTNNNNQFNVNYNNNNKTNINYNNQSSTANNNQYIALNNNNNNYNNFNKPTQTIINNNKNQPNINNNINSNTNTNIPTNTLNNQINEKDFIINLVGSYSELGILETKICNNGILIEEIDSMNILIFLKNIIEDLNSNSNKYSKTPHYNDTQNILKNSSANSKLLKIVNSYQVDKNLKIICKYPDELKNIYNEYLDITLQKAQNNNEKLKCFINANLKHHKLEKMVLENQNTVINNNYNLNIVNQATNNTKTITAPINTNNNNQFNVNYNNNNKTNINYNNQSSTANNNQYIALNNNNNYNNSIKHTETIVNNNMNLNTNTNISSSNKINEKDFIIDVDLYDRREANNKIMSYNIGCYNEIDSIDRLIFLKNILQDLYNKTDNYSKTTHFINTLETLKIFFSGNNPEVRDIMGCLNISHHTKPFILESIKDIEKVKEVYNKYLDIALEKLETNCNKYLDVALQKIDNDNKKLKYFITPNLKLFINANLKHYKLEKIVLNNQNSTVNNNIKMNININNQINNIINKKISSILTKEEEDILKGAKLANILIDQQDSKCLCIKKSQIEELMRDNSENIIAKKFIEYLGINIITMNKYKEGDTFKYRIIFGHYGKNLVMNLEENIIDQSFTGNSMFSNKHYLYGIEEYYTKLLENTVDGNFKDELKKNCKFINIANIKKVGIAL